MYRAILAVALIVAGAGAASAQSYGHRSHGYHRPGPVIVVRHRPVLVPPHRRFGYGHYRFNRHPGWNRRWGW